MIFDVYCDESSPDLFFNQQQGKYAIIGSLWMPYEKRTQFKSDINEIKNEFNYYSEIKWNKVSPNKEEFFIKLIEYFFDSKFLRYRGIVIESDKVNLIKFHKNDAELSFYKFYYQLLHHWLLDFNEYNIYLDIKTNRENYRIKELKNALCNSNFTTLIRNIQSLPSNESFGIQLADLLTGALNGKFNSVITSKTKQTILKIVESNIKHSIVPTSKSEEKFNVFKINLQGGW